MNYDWLLTERTRRGREYPAIGAWIPMGPEDLIRLHRGYPFAEAIPSRELGAATAGVLAEEGELPLQYSGSHAAGRLDRILAERSRRRGLRGEILVTAGIIQAFDLACRAFLSPGDAIGMEAPTYMEALETARVYTDQIIQYPMDRDGLDVDALEQDLKAGRRLKLLYLIPSYQNPTSTCLPPERRARIRQLAAAFDFLILEDDAYGELSFGPMPEPLSVGSDRAIYMGSLSKTVAPGIRIGWSIGPKPLIEAMYLYKKDQDHPLLKAVACRYLEEHDLDSRIEWLRGEYSRRAETLQAALTAYMPRSVTWDRPCGGFFIWLHTPGLDAEALLPKAIAAGITYLPGTTFYHKEVGGHDKIRLSFCSVPGALMDRGVQILAGLHRTHSTG